MGRLKKLKVRTNNIEPKYEKDGPAVITFEVELPASTRRSSGGTATVEFRVSMKSPKVVYKTDFANNNLTEGESKLIWDILNRHDIIDNRGRLKTEDPSNKYDDVKKLLEFREGESDANGQSYSEHLPHVMDVLVQVSNENEDVSGIEYYIDKITDTIRGDEFGYIYVTAFKQPVRVEGFIKDPSRRSGNQHIEVFLQTDETSCRRYSREV